MKFSKYKRYLNTASGDEEIRTLDPLLARQVLSQLSYAPASSQLTSLGSGQVNLTCRTAASLLLFPTNACIRGGPVKGPLLNYLYKPARLVWSWA